MPKKGELITNKTCRGCGVNKPRSAFIGENVKIRVPYDLCKTCRNKRSSEYRKNNREKYLESKRKCRLKVVFGITIAQYEKMLLKQGGTCGICGSKPDKVRLAVDHDHRTGKIRGLLCDSCNRGLGQLGDSEEVLISALEYLGISSTELKARLNAN